MMSCRVWRVAGVSVAFALASTSEWGGEAGAIGRACEGCVEGCDGASGGCSASDLAADLGFEGPVSSSCVA